MPWSLLPLTSVVGDIYGQAYKLGLSPMSTDAAQQKQ